MFINYIKNFWLDFSISHYNRLKKHETNSEIIVLINSSFIQSLNVNTLLILILKLINMELTELKFLIITTIVIFIFNYVYFSRLNFKEKEQLKSRIPKHNRIFYEIYSLISAALPFVLLYMTFNK
jgi:hypothetical protein